MRTADGLHDPDLLPGDDAARVSAETRSSEDERRLLKTTAYQHAPAAAAAQLLTLFVRKPLGLCDIARLLNRRSYHADGIGSLFSTRPARFPTR